MDEVDPKEVAARFAKIPKMPVVELDKNTSMKLSAIIPPPRGGEPKGWCVIGRLVDGDRQDLFAIEADQDTIEILARSFAEAAAELREATSKHKGMGRDI